MKKLGHVVFETAVDAGKYASLIAALNLKGPVLIKPNWGTVECFTEAEILDWTLAAIPGEKIVIESHGWARNEETLLQQGALGLTKANLRKGDRWFLKYSGIDKILAKHNVEYLNLTEEIWAGRAADPAAVQGLVEEKYAPVQQPELYSKVPARIFDLRGGSLLSLAKYKLVFDPLGVSMSMKNLFGLIPGPSRGKFHGKDHALLDQSITDINKIYRSLFALNGVIDIVRAAGTLASDGERTRVLPGCDLALASQDTVSLDAFATALSGRDPGSVGHLRLAAQTFGAWDEQTCADAEKSGISFSFEDGFSIR
jgi:uncharacterized protein (DUF362 family)